MATYPGGPGQDIIQGDGEDDIINGNGGNDNLKGGGGNDTIDGGDDDDIIQGGAGQDTLNGGNGIDRVDYTTFNGDGIYNLVAGTANLGIFTETILNFESILAGNGNDTITLPSFSDNLLNLGSPAETFAGGGNDLVNGGAEYDYIYGDAGNDTLNGNAGDDYLYGDAGDDTINGGIGDDYIQGGLGQDTLDGGAGIDQVDYTTFNGNGVYDLVAGTANLGVFTEQILNFETIIAGNGNDIITLPSFVPSTSNNFFGSINRYTLAGGGNDLVNGGTGDDIIFGDSYGQTGNDTLYGGAGDDYIYGGDGNDFIQGGLGKDSLDGGDGNDTVDYTTFNGGGTYSLQVGTAGLTGAFSETMLNFENINTGAGNDIIYGSNLDNRIFGGAGNDEIHGLDGDDYIQGGLGRDMLYGENGNDTVDYTTFNGGGTYNLTAGTAILPDAFTETMSSFENIYTGAGNDTIVGTAGMNRLYGGAGDDNISGGDGDDYIQGGLGRDTLNGGNGNDTVDYTTFSGDGSYSLDTSTANLGVFIETISNFENIIAGAGSDSITGTAVDNYLSGGAGNDNIFGLQGNDLLAGGDGIDYILGGDGNDSIRGNAGDDDLFGNAGIDSFRFGDGVLSATNTVAGSIGKDTIYDFTKGTDKIVLTSNAFNLTQSAFSANLLNLSFQSVANDALAETSTAAIVYSEGSQSLSYNPNGTAAGFGYGGTFATVGGMAPGTSLDPSNFVISTPILTGFGF